jgi:hypothetical protein
MGQNTKPISSSIRTVIQRGVCHENILIQIQPVYDDLFDPGVLPWGRADLSTGGCQANQHAQADEYTETNQYPLALEYTEADLHSLVHIFAHRYQFAAANSYIHQHTDIYAYGNPH